jgi:hypothetical protein
VVAILVGDLKCRTQFWKGTTQGSFQQRLVEIGSVVSEEKIFFQLQPNFGEMILEWPLPKLCPVIPTSNQDGRQAKNRKTGG